MVKEKVKKSLICLLGSGILAGMLCVMGDLALAWRGTDVRCSYFLLAAVALTAVFYCRFRRKPRRAFQAAAWLMGVTCVIAAGLFACWFFFQKDAAFENADQGKRQLYAERRVMLIVPHQDDDINVLGGVMEELVRYGSQVYPVFVTNGDAEDLAEERFREVLDVFAYIGVPSENITFLGYGDTWAEGGPHLYNAPAGQIMTSKNGKTATYGTSSQGAFREGREYTSDHLLEDLAAVILQHKPDVIFCSDYDLHIDHRAVTLAFEKVMGDLLKAHPDYRPLVFKGYAYSTAWYAQPDFYALNLLSTQNVFGEPYRQTPEVYRWESRVRLPVGADTLSRSLFTSGIYRTLELYASQDAVFQAARVINGDKVFWFRDTHSLCLNADIAVSSGNGHLLNDFMLLENHDLVGNGDTPYDGVWAPEGETPSASVTFRSAADVRIITLYDNPSPRDNVLGGRIVFEDGSEIPFGPLAPGGAGVQIPVEKTGVSSFTVVLTDVEGERPGLTEIEAFSRMPEPGLRYVKLMDRDENFVYDWIMEDSEGFLDVYTQGLTEEEVRSLTLSWNNTKCWAEFEDGRIRIICPEGKEMLLTVALDGTDISDTVRISNPGELTCLYYKLCQTLEAQVFQKYCDGAHRNSAAYKLLMTAVSLIR